MTDIAAWMTDSGSWPWPHTLSVAAKQISDIHWGHSAAEILPQFQDVKTGDELPLGSGRQKMRVEVLEPGRVFTIRPGDGNWVWIFALFGEDGVTRLVSRNRIAAPGASVFSRLFSRLFMEPGSLVMERKMLLGIKERAERLARDRENSAR